MKKGFELDLEYDINKLFEAINLRASKNLNISEMRRNPSKKPMRNAGSHSPVIGFSEPVSLKQALRGLCISQAAEVAATKRLSMASLSPRISEALRITNMYRSSLAETGQSAFSVTDDQKPEIESCCSSSSFDIKPDRVSSDSCHQLAESSVRNIGETSPCSSAELPLAVLEPKKMVLNQDSHSSPHFRVNLVINGVESEPASETDTQLPHQSSLRNSSKPDHEFLGPNNVVMDPSKNSTHSSKLVTKTAAKLRHKWKLQTVSSSSAKRNSRNLKLNTGSYRTQKPVVRNRYFVIKKTMKLALSTHGNSKQSLKVKNGHDQFICHKCKCSSRGTNVSGVFTDSEVHDERKPISFETSLENRATPASETSKISKKSDKGDIFHSSKSSICDFSSSFTSLSEESNLSGPTFCNRPHMSKDVRWEAINEIVKHGFLELSHFNLLEKLGSGDIGTVYLAELKGTDCVFAIKVMDNEFLAGRKKLSRAHTEREILGMLDHPFLPTLYSHFTSDNLSCLLMEFCPGGDLHVLRQKQPGRFFPEQAARFYAAEVLLALEYLHMLGIIYRDLKPENILVRKDGHIMLTDFDLSLRCSVSPTLVESSGIEPPRFSGPCAGSKCIDPFCNAPSCKMSCFNSKVLPSTARTRRVQADRARSVPQLVAEPTEARSNSFVGTHEYLAPEIIRGHGHGSAVDWWTFGVLLYELLYGKTPFKGARNDETLANVMGRNLRFPEAPIVSFHARDLIRGLLVKDPENRLGMETGAAEIKRHPFFKGLNWALIRCTVPPQIPE